MTNEIKVYIVNCSESEIYFRNLEKAGDYEPIMAEAELLGTVYSLQGFQEACNNEELDLSNSFILIN